MDDRGWGGEAKQEEVMTEPRYSGLTEIGDEIKGLHGTIDDLEKRLGPILENYPDKDTAGPEPVPATALRGHAKDIAGARRRIGGLIGRLDLP